MEQEAHHTGRNDRVFPVLVPLHPQPLSQRERAHLNALVEHRGGGGVPRDRIGKRAQGLVHGGTTLMERGTDIGAPSAILTVPHRVVRLVQNRAISVTTWHHVYRVGALDTEVFFNASLPKGNRPRLL